ncbi:MAG: disulfide oxidoreductase, partial [Celeribacter marinus]
LSITGMTLEQFANLMDGLGYKSEKAERVKVKAADRVVAAQAATTPVEAAPTGDVAPVDVAPVDAAEVETAEAAEEVAPQAPVADVAETETPVAEAADAAVVEAEMEVFYTFTWGGNRGGNRRQGGQNQGQDQGARPQAKQGGKPAGKGGPRRDGKGGPRRDGGKGKGGDTKPQNFSARPPRKEKPIDPDNPFAAALMGLKDKK